MEGSGGYLNQVDFLLFLSAFISSCLVKFYFALLISHFKYSRIKNEMASCLHFIFICLNPNHFSCSLFITPSFPTSNYNHSLISTSLNTNIPFYCFPQFTCFHNNLRYLSPPTTFHIQNIPFLSINIPISKFKIKSKLFNRSKINNHNNNLISSLIFLLHFYLFSQCKYIFF